jgi:hypothetical protein
MLMERSREEGELIIAIVVIGRCCDLQVVKIIFVPAGRNTVSTFISVLAVLHCTVPVSIESPPMTDIS